MIDLLGAGLTHLSRLKPYMKEWTRGDAYYTVPDMRSVTFFVRSNRRAASLFNFVTRSFFGKHLKATSFLLKANMDPFTASTEFAAKFDKCALPEDLGGSATVQDPLPAVTDDVAVWAK